MSSNSQSKGPLPKILAVDDHPENLLVIKTLLRSVDAEVITARSGEDALAQVIRHEFAVILMDVQMPEMDGFETATLIRAHAATQYTPLIFVTAFARSEELMAQGYQVGAVDYLTKPIEGHIFVTKIQVFLELYHQRATVEPVLQELQVSQNELSQEHAKLSETNALLTHEILERQALEAEREVLHRQLVLASRQAGMADVATGILHNVGNILTSVSVSTGVIKQLTQHASAEKLQRISAMLQEHLQDLGNFLTHDPKGQKIPEYLMHLGDHWAREQGTLNNEIQGLKTNIEHIAQVIQMQQTIAKTGGVTESVSPAELMEQAWHINMASLDRHRIEVIRDYEEMSPVLVERHQVLQILVNLISNAKYAVLARKGEPGCVVLKLALKERMVQFQVRDNGVGIKPEHLIRIFAQGFTTKKEGHGFGLHSAALNAKNLGGSLAVHSDGEGQGATFTLEFPAKPEETTVASPSSSHVAGEE